MQLVTVTFEKISDEPMEEFKADFIETVMALYDEEIENLRVVGL